MPCPRRRACRGGTQLPRLLTVIDDFRFTFNFTGQAAELVGGFTLHSCFGECPAARSPAAWCSRQCGGRSSVGQLLFPASFKNPAGLQGGASMTPWTTSASTRGRRALLAA